jgi:hypothetical protein
MNNNQMTFSVGKNNGKPVYYINNKEVSKKAYESLMDEHMVGNESEYNEECPFCSMVHDILTDILAADKDEAFDILHSVLDGIKEAGYQAGYIECMRTNARLMNEVADQMESELEEEE